MDYEFDRMPKVKRNNSSGRRILIFMIVLAITSGIVYWIVPHKKTVPAERSAQIASDKEVAKNNPATSEPGSADKTASAIPEETVTQENAETAEKTAKVPTQKPVKGVAWQGDPAVDLPEKPIPDETAKAEAQRSADNWEQVQKGTGVWCIKHAISRGDNLEKLAKNYHTTVALIKELNHLKGNTIFLGRKLVIVPGPWQIEISKSSRRLQLFNLAKEKTLFAAYDVGVGRADSTPAEKFVISSAFTTPTITRRMARSMLTATPKIRWAIIF